MKIVKNYKQLKKWAKTLFVTLLTICIVFTSTGVATLFAYADPADEPQDIDITTDSGDESESDSEIISVTPEATPEISPQADPTETEESSQESDTDPQPTDTASAQNNEPVVTPSNRQLDSAPLLRGFNDEDMLKDEAFKNDRKPCGKDFVFDGSRKQVFDKGEYKSTVKINYKNYNLSGDMTYTMDCEDVGSYGLATNAGNYTMRINATYIYDQGPIFYSSPEQIDLEWIFYAEIKPRPISDLDIAQKNYKNFKNEGFLIDGLTKDVDYTYSEVTEIPEAGGAFEVTLNGIGNYTSEVKGTVKVEEVDILFNGSAQSAEPYIDKVILSAGGYKLSLDPNGEYNETLVISEKGTKDYTVYCQDKTDATVIIKKTVKNLTIEEATTSITVGDYSSNKIAASEDVAYYTSEAKEIIIKSTKNDPGVSKIEYATSDEMYYSISDIEGAVVDENMKWKPYNDTGRPTIPQNKAFYVYALITYTDGSYEYISTAKIIHDTTPPEITSAILTAKEKEDSDDNILVVLGKDSLIGIDTFYMLYEEKTEDSKIPKAKDVVKEGKGSGVETRNKEDAGASYTLSDLDTDKTYIFHIVAVDKLGNLSEVKTIESKGKAKSASSSSDNSSSEQASKLQPAPNGIAGSGDAKPPKTGTTGIPQKTQNSETKSPLDREINRIPYISDATGDTKIGLAATGGWDKINNEVKNADAGGSIDVEMSGFSVVPDKIFKTLMGKDLRVKFLLPEDVEFIVNGKDIETAKNSDIDIGVRIGARNIPTDMLDAITGVYPHTEIELKHDGEFGFSGILRIPLGKSNAGLYAYLYYYNTKTKEMELIQSTQITSTGYAEFSLVHASDYSIVIRSEEMLTTGSDKNNTALALTQASENKNAHSVLRLTDFAGSRASVRMWLFLIAIISAVMCGLILYMPGLKTEDSVE